MAVNLKQTCYYKSILRQEGRGSAVPVDQTEDKASYL